MNEAPSLLNGPTIYGRFGQKRLRHPRELMIMWIAVAVSFFIALGYMTMSEGSLWGCDASMERVLGREYCEDLASSAPHDLGVADVIGMLFGFMIALSIMIVCIRALMYARLRSNAVRMSPTQFPEGYRMVVEAAERFGLRRIPDAYVVLGNGQINAFASGHGYRRFVAVYSDLFEVGGSARDPQALRFVINHEVGHIAAGHTSFFRLLGTMIGLNVPILGQALSRAQEYTADNYGYDAVPHGSTGVIGLLGAGKYLGSQVNFHAMADRAAYEGGFWLHVANWLNTHPVLTWRAHALRDRSVPGKIMIKPARNRAWAPALIPSGDQRTGMWPTPAQMLGTLEAVKPATGEEQFGRFPGVEYSEPADTLRLANPSPIPVPQGFAQPGYPASQGASAPQASQPTGYPAPGYPVAQPSAGYPASQPAGSPAQPAGYPMSEPTAPSQPAPTQGYPESQPSTQPGYPVSGENSGDAASSGTPENQENPAE